MKLFILGLSIIVFSSVSYSHAYESPNPIHSKIRLPIPAGQKMIRDMKLLETSTNLTSSRKELKSVVSNQTWERILASLRTGGAGNPTHSAPPFDLKLRDAVAESGRRRGNLTFYGKAASFTNLGGMKTKIRMRARIYFTSLEDYREAKRDPITQNRAYLEIKIKNPTAEQRDGSDKYRILLDDEDLLRLFRADATAPEFSNFIQDLKAHAAQIPENDPKKIDGILNLVETLAQFTVPGDRNTPVPVGVDFIRPRYVTTYFRDSYEIKERDYEIPVVEIPPRLNEYKEILRFERTPEKIKFVKSDVKYQITVDDHVRAVLPKTLPTDTSIDINQYLFTKEQDPSVSYPLDSKTIELKLPVVISQLRMIYRSPLHKFITQFVSDPMEKEILPGFSVNKGKSGHLSGMLKRVLQPKPRYPGFPEALEGDVLEQ